MDRSLYVGLMSGTSLDGIDAALVDFSDGKLQLIGAATYPIPADLHTDLLSLTQPGHDEIDRLGSVDIRFAQAQAAAVQSLLAAQGVAAAAVCAVGSHGQTLRHRPDCDPAFTLQIGDPNTLAEATGIDVIADFRRRDMAAGGQGAPLVPAFHADRFRSPHADRVILNIGGMANITLLPADPDALISGFDTGPGNILMDACIQHHCQQPFDKHGAWAASGTVSQALLARLLSDSYFAAPPPKSTGRERFNSEWLASHQASCRDAILAADLQATLLELTARSIAQELQPRPAAEVYVCGGGAHNNALLQRLQVLLGDRLITTTSALGLDPDWVEATAFAWLAKRFMDRLPGNLPAVTGARGPRILGALYPA